MKTRLLLFVIVAVLVGVVLVGCGQKSNGTTPPTTPTQTPVVPTAPSRAGIPVPSVPGLTWDDIPIYRGLQNVQQASYTIPPTQGDYAKFEWRYYESSDSVENIASFYKKEMPARGWTEAGWMEVPQMNYGIYNKNDEKDAAMVMVSSQGGKTVVALWRATQK